ncbi:hypothetical protein AB0M87_08420 [Streptomyces sp. NPDC051320]|uniref:hypothetical protein n=1 Tax=Streptomyces sp. NPDC051320 TaxID=3154644 RepID=UPI0034354242
MDSLPNPGSPIYDQLVQEHGDVLAEIRKLAVEALEQADPAQFWGSAPAWHLPVESAKSA